jgi:hypothetical protein
MNKNIFFKKIKLIEQLIYIKIFGKMNNIISDEQYNKRIYKIRFGKNPDLDNPKTFNENIINNKVFDDEYYLSKYTDKYDVRKYVEKKIGKEYLNEIYDLYNSVDDIDFSKLPSEFALKATHGSGWNIIVKDKDDINLNKVKRLFKKWLHMNYYYVGREKNYKNIKGRIICEKYLDLSEGLIEYKVFCFNGKARFFTYNLEWSDHRISNYYYPDGSYIDVGIGYQHSPKYELTDNYKTIIELAEKLAADFKFVRVDLYSVKGKIYFSELTFHPNGGFSPFNPEEYDINFGTYFNK